MWYPPPADPEVPLTPAEKAIINAENLAFISAEHAVSGIHLLGRLAYDQCLSPSRCLALGRFDFQNDVFKLALIKNNYSYFISGSGTSLYYWDFLDDEAISIGTGYTAGGQELQNKVIANNDGITTITWDDVTFNAGSGEYFDHDLWVEEYFDHDIWVEGTTGLVRRSVLAIIYDDTAHNKPVIQMSIVPSPNAQRFLSAGDSHTITNIKVKI